MIDQPWWQELEKRREEIESLLQAGVSDQAKRHQLHKELSRLSSACTLRAQLQKLSAEKEQICLQKESERDQQMHELFAAECTELEKKIEKGEHELDLFLFPPDELDSRAAFIEIRAGAGGQEAALFVADLMRMYIGYGTRCGWNVSVMSMSQTDLGGFRELILQVDGVGAYGALKHEAGVPSCTARSCNRDFRKNPYIHRDCCSASPY